MALFRTELVLLTGIGLFVLICIGIVQIAYIQSNQSTTLLSFSSPVIGDLEVIQYDDGIRCITTRATIESCVKCKNLAIEIFDTKTQPKHGLELYANDLKCDLDHSHLVFHYLRSLRHVAPVFDAINQASSNSPLYDSPRRVLLLGLGGCAFPNWLYHTYPKMHVDVVELDAGIIKISELAFECPVRSPDKRFRVINDDAAKYLKHADSHSYDIIISDISASMCCAVEVDSVADHEFCHHKSHCTPIPSLTTQEFFDQVKRTLKPNGLLAVHAWNSPSYYAKYVMETMDKQFPVVSKFLTQNGSDYLLFGSYAQPSSLMQIQRQVPKSARAAGLEDFSDDLINEFQGFSGYKAHSWGASNQEL